MLTDAYTMQVDFEESSADCLAQHCSNSIANALELLQSCTRLSVYPFRRNKIN